MHLPSDELMRPPVLQSTEGVSIEQSAAEGWPWLVQMGHLRAGLYGYGLTEMAGPVTALMTRGMLRGIRRRAVHQPTCMSRPATSQAPTR